jgi:hypothetical protein
VIHVGTGTALPVHEVLDCHEFGILEAKFSTGASLAELASVAEVIAVSAKIAPPPREAKRNFGLMVQWFRTRWRSVAPWLPLVALTDVDGWVIDGRRELLERGMLGKRKSFGLFPVCFRRDILLVNCVWALKKPGTAEIEFKSDRPRSEIAATGTAEDPTAP